MKLGTVPPSYGTNVTRVYTTHPWNVPRRSDVTNIPEKFPLFYANEGLVSADTHQIPDEYAVSHRARGGPTRLPPFAGAATASHCPRGGPRSFCPVTAHGFVDLVYLCGLPIWPGEPLMSSFLPRKLPYVGPLYGLRRHMTGSAVPHDILQRYIQGAGQDTVHKRPKAANVVSRISFLEQMSVLCAAEPQSSAGTFYLKENLYVDDKQPEVYVAKGPLSEADLRNLCFYEIAKRVFESGSTDEAYAEAMLHTEWFEEVQLSLTHYRKTKTLPRDAVDHDIGCVRQSGHLPLELVAGVANFDMFSVVGVSLSFYRPGGFERSNWLPVIAVYLFS